MRKMFNLLGVMLALASSLGANAAVLRVDLDTGQLLGADGVLVGDSLFDVEFSRGTCVELFSGCNSQSDLPFLGFLPASTAAQALLDQVLLDVVQGNFDSDPALTRGCMDSSSCTILIPRSTNSVAPDFISAVPFFNQAGDGDLVISEPGASGSAFLELPSITTTQTYAIFTPSVAAPEPVGLLLFVAGLAGLLATHPRRLKIELAA